MINMNDNEKESIEKLLKLAKFAIICIMVTGGYLSSGALMGLV